MGEGTAVSISHGNVFVTLPVCLAAARAVCLRSPSVLVTTLGEAAAPGLTDGADVGEGHGSQPVWLERPPSHAQRGAGRTQTGTQHPGMRKLCDPRWPKGRQWPEVPPGELSSDWVGGLGRRGCGRDPDPHWAKGQADAGGWQDEASLSKSLLCVQRLPDTCHRYHEHPPLGSPSGCLEPGPPGSELAGSSVLDGLSLRCTRGLWELGRLHRDPGREGWARDKNPMDRAG